LPKEEREKKTHQLAAKRPGRGETGTSNLRSALLGPSIATNTAPSPAALSRSFALGAFRGSARGEGAVLVAMLGPSKADRKLDVPVSPRPGRLPQVDGSFFSLSSLGNSSATTSPSEGLLELPRRKNLRLPL